MSLALKQPHVSLSDLISVGSLVRVNGRDEIFRVSAITKDRQSACVNYGREYFWCFLSELRFIA